MLIPLTKASTGERIEVEHSQLFTFRIPVYASRGFRYVNRLGYTDPETGNVIEVIESRELADEIYQKMSQQEMVELPI